jgi:hypothetical protein
MALAVQYIIVSVNAAEEAKDRFSGMSSKQWKKPMDMLMLHMHKPNLFINDFDCAKCFADKLNYNNSKSEHKRVRS